MKHHHLIQHVHKFLMIVVILISFTSCYNYKNLQLLQENKSLPQYQKTSYVDYKIKVNDELVYRVITTDENITKMMGSAGGSSQQNQISYRVYPDGTIDLPYMSKIPVAGLTLAQASAAVEARFREMVPDALVKLSLANKTYTIIGANGSGNFPIYKEKMNIFQALSQAGDFTESSDRKHVRIVRDTEKGMEILEFDIRPKSIIDSKYYYVYPNDIIYIRQDGSAFYKVNNYNALLGIITFSMSLLFNVLN